MLRRRVIALWAAAFGAFCISAGSACADLSTNEFLKQQYNSSSTDRALSTIYLKGMEEGMEWMNAWLEPAQKHKLYCPPEKIVLTGEQLADMVRRHIKNHPEDDYRPLGMVLLVTLIEDFSCRRP
jgi:hypothetical protein